MSTPDPLRAAVGRVAYYSRRGESPAKLEEAKRNLAALQIERAVTEALASAPPLTDKQVEYLASLLSAAAKHVAAEGGDEA